MSLVRQTRGHKRVCIFVYHDRQWVEQYDLKLLNILNAIALIQMGSDK